MAGFVRVGDKSSAIKIHLHQFRIAGKRLRYRVELLVELEKTKPNRWSQRSRNYRTHSATGMNSSVLIDYVRDHRPSQLSGDHPDIGRRSSPNGKRKLHNQTTIHRLLTDAAKSESWVRWKPLIEESLESPAR